MNLNGWLVTLAALLLPSLALGQEGTTPRAQEAPPASSVRQVRQRHDRELIRDLKEYLAKNVAADDREEAYQLLFARSIDHDWFAEVEVEAARYVRESQQGPSYALAQIVLTMAAAKAGKYPDALSNYQALMAGLVNQDQLAFALDFADTLAREALAAGQEKIAREVYLTLKNRFGDVEDISAKVEGELDRLDLIGKPAPDLESTDTEGRTIRLAELRGKPYLIIFGASWCEPYLLDLPDLKAAYQSLRDRGFQVVNISLDQTAEQARQFAKNQSLPFPTIHNATSGLDWVAVFGVNSIPASYLVDAKGIISRLDLRSSALRTLPATLTSPAPTPPAP
jgi:peroxiredoxin